MATYSFDFKLKVVKFYLKGNGYSSTAEFKHRVLHFMFESYYSAREAAAYFNIPIFTSVLEWQSLKNLIDKLQSELAYLSAENDVLKSLKNWMQRKNYSYFS